MSLPDTSHAISKPKRLQQELRQKKPFVNLQAEAFLNLVRTADQLQHALRTGLKPYGITETQYNVLRILRGSSEQGLTCSEIGQRVISQEPDITRLLGRMERQNLVRRERDLRDRRVVLTRITPKGLADLQQLDRLVNKLVDGFLAHMRKDELQLLIDLLEKTRSPALLENSAAVPTVAPSL